MEMMTGIAGDFARGRSIGEIWEALSAGATSAHQEALQGEHFFLQNLKLNSTAGEAGYADLALTALRESGKVVAVLGTLVDVTSRFEAREELARMSAASELNGRRFQTLIDSLPDAALIINQNGVINSFNSRAKAMARNLTAGGTFTLEMLAPGEPWFSLMRIWRQPVDDQQAFELEIADPLCSRTWSVAVRAFPSADPADNERLVVCRDTTIPGLQQPMATRAARRWGASQLHEADSKVVALPQTLQDLDPFLGRSPEIQRLRATAAQILNNDAPIVIEGETGCGKNVLARWLHRHGRRCKGSFVDLNCAGLSTDLLESELFGHHKGAFTGAIADKKGLLAQADGGTLFLDEVGDTTLAVQGKLLKVVEEKRYRALGDVRERTTNLRLIAATNRDLRQLVERRQFRGDLFHRICVLPLTIPPLRQRRLDIVAIARTLLSRMLAEHGLRELILDKTLLKVLEEHHWPGNIRQMDNVLRRALLLSDGGSLRPEHLIFEETPPFASAEPAATGAETLKETEERRIRSVLQEENGSVGRAAKRLGIARSSLYNKLKAMRPG